MEENLKVDKMKIWEELYKAKDHMTKVGLFSGYQNRLKNKVKIKNSSFFIAVVSTTVFYKRTSIFSFSS